MVESFELPPLAVDRALRIALEEDLSSGDITTEACIDAEAIAVARCVARSSVIVCGGPVFARAFRLVDASLAVATLAPEGSRAFAATALWEVRGRARAILMAERVALNFAQRLSGIATQTRAFVDALPSGSPMRITDTRKTTPGLRALERYAVRVGGGHNHRDNLGAAVLIKDNHIAACGGIAEAIGRARAAAPHTSKIECEVDSLDQLEEALAAKADVVLLDNMPTPLIAEAVRRTRGRAVLEASGNIAIDRVAELAKAGVDAVSVGALTHSTRSADLGLDFA